MSDVDRSHLPIRRPPFAGKIDKTLDGSQPDWNLMGHPTPPEGAPNVLLVLIDDAGFGNPSTFGGPIETPNYTRVAEKGLRYNRLHVTALCSPTRASLLTGRNNHAVGFGSIGEFAGGFPGYSANLPRDCAPLPRILRDNGYSTAIFGKWHLTPDGQQGAAGPFDRWPNGWGFDHFYGILGGGSSQWDPCLAENQKIIGTPDKYYDSDEPFYFPDAMADRTIEWLHAVRAQDADKPFFVYYSTGCSHAPHHVTKTWADKYKGKFDQGWDKLREETFARQKELGVIPADTELTPRDDAFPAWDDVPDKLKAFYARQMEVYSGFSENADYNVGRVIDAIEELGELDNTLILWIWGDNGASMEGTITGSFNELTMQNGIPLTDEMQLQLAERYGGLEEWGSADDGPPLLGGMGVGRRHALPVGQAGRLTPRRNPQSDGRAVARSHQGCGRAALPVRPRHRRGPDHTLGRRYPRARHRRRDRPGADARLIVCRVIHRRRRSRAPHPAVLRDPWQPRHVQRRLVAGNEDRADPVGAHPRGARPLRTGRLGPRRGAGGALLPTRRLLAGKGRCGRPSREGSGAQGPVLGGGREIQSVASAWRLSTFFGILPPIPEKTTYEYRGDVQNVMPGMIPRIYNRSYTITADLVVPEGGAEGVIVAEADHLGGFTLYVKDGKLTHTYSMMGVFIYKQVAEEDLPPGTSRCGWSSPLTRPSRPRAAM